jgi:hypothetical protein
MEKYWDVKNGGWLWNERAMRSMSELVQKNNVWEQMLGNAG